MKELLPCIPFVFFILAYTCSVLELLRVDKENKSVLSKKDCMVAEFSPDFSQKEKELCRELKGKK